MSPLVIDNFSGAMTAFQYGSINSGRSYIEIVSGQNPFIKPGQLTWSQTPIQIDPNRAVITDLIMAGKERVESGILYVYAIGHTGRVYKIQVNNPSTYNPDYDNPALLTTLSIGSPTFTRGASIDFFGGTEQIYIGHDVGLTQINFDGTGEVAVSGSWVATVPRPSKQFVGKLYVGNGNNIAEVLTGGTVSTSTKFSPAFPNNTQVRDIDVSPDGNYLEMVVSRLALGDITSANLDVSQVASSDSYIMKWNGSDTNITSYNTYPSFSLNANIMFQNYQYVFGTDQFGSAVFNPTQKILTGPESPSPQPNAISSTGNLLATMAPVFFDGQLQGYFQYFGSRDFEVGHPIGFWSPFFTVALAPQTDVVCIPYMQTISNTGYGSSSNNYTHNIFGTSKIYFSQLETSGTPSTAYRLYKWDIATSALQSQPVTNALYQAIYQTQTEMYSKKVVVSEVRIYGEPWIAGNSFSIDLIGSAGTAITGGSYTFTASTNSSGIATSGQMIIGQDYAWYGPDMAPTYALGVAITNLGNTNFTINKIEIDTEPAGK